VDKKYNSKIKEITANRLEPFSVMADIEYIIEKGFANNIDEALNVNDKYVYLSQAMNIINADVQAKFNEYLINKK